MFDEAPFSPSEGLQLVGVTKSYGGGCVSGQRKKPAVDNLSFKVQSGTCAVLLGENGAGKSTIMYVI